jgi:hypothetical protein
MNPLRLRQIWGLPALGHINGENGLVGDVRVVLVEQPVAQAQREAKVLQRRREKPAPSRRSESSHPAEEGSGTF